MTDLYWHFLPDDGHLRFGTREKVEVGKTIKVDCEPILCEQGLHASRRAIDALRYAPGALVCRVTLGGKIVTAGDKSVGQERTVAWMADATETLHRFACDVARETLDRHAPDFQAGYVAVETKLRWLAGNATDNELAAARYAARDAAWDAARDAAWDAARDAAWCASSAAAMDANNERLTDALLALGPD